MPSDEVNHTFEIESEQRDWLGEIAEEYGFADEDKALRVLLDYAIQDWGQRPDLRGSQHALPKKDEKPSRRASGCPGRWPASPKAK